MKTTVNWGILGPGKIAHKFADAFRSVPSARLYAIASRDVARGKEFAEKFGAEKIYTDYTALVSDPTVDIIYIATPHPFHHDQTLLCLNHRKPVVCEKPLAVTLKEAEEMITLARSSGTFLMEGMWSRFFPATIKAAELVHNGTIGEVKFMRTDFGFSSPFNPESRVYNLNLAGGAQLDVGVYPTFLTLLLLGKPDVIQAMAHKAPTGADETTTVQFHYDKGTIAHFMSSIAADTPRVADIIGTLGTITMHSQWHKSQSITLKMKAGESQTFEFPYSGFGFEYQLEHATSCIREGLLESNLMNLDLSLLMAEMADEILRQCGIVYPNNKKQG